jgi:dihydrofolate reductase
MRKLFSVMMATADGYYARTRSSTGRTSMRSSTISRSSSSRRSRHAPLSKIVASRTLDEAGWTNTRLVTDVTDELGELKSEPGKDIAILGSSNLTASLLQAGLVDELRIMVNPVLLGAGKSLFTETDETISLKLLDSRRFDSGNVLLIYQPANS